MTESNSKSGDKPASEPHIPPPTDPYVTYQTPYPRRPSDDVQNPFIEFRRLADAAFSSVFSALPRILGTENFKNANIQESDNEFVKAFDQQAKEFENRIAEMVKARFEEAEGFRKKLEQDWEEGRRENEKRMEEESHRWEMMRRGLERCPGLRPEGHGGKSEAETELDLYDGLKAYEASAYKPKNESGTSQPKKHHWNSRSDGTCPWKGEDGSRGGWMSGLGWDGHRRAKNIPLYISGKSEADTNSPTNVDWQEYNDAEMDPFTNDDHVVPWLRLSPYSPLSLITDTSDYEDVDQVLNELPWDEAFEDLMSVHKTGQLPSTLRRLVYWGGPNQWMTDMALRGSLGPEWKEGLMVAALLGAVDGNHWKGFDGLTEQCRQLAGKEFRKVARQPSTVEETTNANEINDDNDDIENDWVRLMSEGSEPKLLEAFQQIEALAQSLFGDGKPADKSFGARGMHWPSPEEVIAAMREDQLATEREDSRNQQSPNANGNQVLTTSFMTNSSWASTEAEKPEGLISTLTTTTTTILPDGSVETRRILKKKFSDGREENSESTEIQAAERKVTNDTSTQTEYDDTPRRKQTKNGWFWN